MNREQRRAHERKVRNQQKLARAAKTSTTPLDATPEKDLAPHKAPKAPATAERPARKTAAKKGRSTTPASEHWSRRVARRAGKVLIFVSTVGGLLGFYSCTSRGRFDVSDRTQNAFLTQFIFRNDGQFALNSVTCFCAPKLAYNQQYLTFEGIDFGGTSVYQDELAPGAPMNVRCKDPFEVITPTPDFKMELRARYSYTFGLTRQDEICTYEPELTNGALTGWRAAGCRHVRYWLPSILTTWRNEHGLL